MKAKYDRIGKAYNSTRKADPYLTQKLLEHLNPVDDERYLDIGCGTGNYTCELKKQGLQLVGIDPSIRMLEKAKQNNKSIDWKVGTAEKIDLADNSVSGVIGSLTIHHWTDLPTAFSELFRVLKPEGRVVIFTSTPKQMEGYWLNHYFPKMLKDSSDQMPSQERVLAAMKSVGFEFLMTEKYFIHANLEDKFLYCGKHNPEVYFDERIRHGISSFSSLANRAEVKHGLAELKRDIESGKIKEIIRRYDNDLGDYLYVIGRKPAGK